MAAVADTGAGGRSNPCGAALFVHPVNNAAGNAKKSVMRRRDVDPLYFITLIIYLVLVNQFP